ncbi:hypothetical protein P8452_73525 [Trifolium repens]|nr:hypothetical protein P8452_73525 [Trifolium repens]
MEALIKETRKFLVNSKTELLKEARRRSVAEKGVRSKLEELRRTQIDSGSPPPIDAFIFILPKSRIRFDHLNFIEFLLYFLIVSSSSNFCSSAKGMRGFNCGKTFKTKAAKSGLAIMITDDPVCIDGSVSDVFVCLALVVFFCFFAPVGATSDLPAFVFFLFPPFGISLSAAVLPLQDLIL